VQAEEEEEGGEEKEEEEEEEEEQPAVVMEVPQAGEGAGPAGGQPPPSSLPSATAAPHAPQPTAAGPVLVFRESEPPVLRCPDGPATQVQVLREVRLTGAAGEPVVARVPALAAHGGGRTPGGRPDVPLVVKATVEEGEGAFGVSPTYLSLSPAAGAGGGVLTVRLHAARAGQYAGTLRLEYMGVRARVTLTGLLRAHGPAGADDEADGDDDGWADPLDPAQPAAPAPIVWSKLAVGCAASREVRLRSVLPGRALVRASVEGGGAAGGFAVEGEGEVPRSGMLRLVVSFAPTRAGPHEAALRVVVWEGEGGERAEGPSRRRTYLRSRDGTLDCWVGRGEWVGGGERRLVP
jgi:hypothetical protein